MGRKPKIPKDLALFLEERADASGFVAICSNTLLRRLTEKGVLYFRIPRLERGLGHVPLDAIRLDFEHPEAWPAWEDMPLPSPIENVDNGSISGGPESAALSLLAALQDPISIWTHEDKILLITPRACITGPIDEWRPGSEPSGYVLPKNILNILTLGARQYKIDSTDDRTDIVVEIDSGALRIVERITWAQEPENVRAFLAQIASQAPEDSITIGAKKAASAIAKQENPVQISDYAPSAAEKPWGSYKVESSDFARTLRACGKGNVAISILKDRLRIDKILAEGWRAVVLHEILDKNA